MSKKGQDSLILEDSNFFALYGAAPVSPGHAIIMPKNHVVSFFDLAPELVGPLHIFLSKVKARIEKDHKPDAYNVGVNNGIAAGRSVHHLHIHLIPRYEGDVDNPRGEVRNLLGNNISPASIPKDFS